MDESGKKKSAASAVPIHVTHLARNDVLLGRGSGPNDHPGNCSFRDEIRRRKSEYMATMDPTRKAGIALDIIRKVHATGGRFLKKAEGSASRARSAANGYEVVLDFQVLKSKIKQAFRYLDEKTEESSTSSRIDSNMEGNNASQQVDQPEDLNHVDSMILGSVEQQASVSGGLAAMSSPLEILERIRTSNQSAFPNEVSNSLLPPEILSRGLLNIHRDMQFASVEHQLRLGSEAAEVARLPSSSNLPSRAGLPLDAAYYPHLLREATEQQLLLSRRLEEQERALVLHNHLGLSPLLLRYRSDEGQGDLPLYPASTFSVMPSESSTMAANMLNSPQLGSGRNYLSSDSNDPLLRQQLHVLMQRQRNTLHPVDLQSFASPTSSLLLPNIRFSGVQTPQSILFPDRRSVMTGTTTNNLTSNPLSQNIEALFLSQRSNQASVTRRSLMMMGLGEGAANSLLLELGNPMRGRERVLENEVVASSTGPVSTSTSDARNSRTGLERKIEHTDDGKERTTRPSSSARTRRPSSSSSSSGRARKRRKRET